MSTAEGAPFRVLTLGGAGDVPWYMVPFDKKGRCEDPAVRAAAVAALASGDFTDVYLFCHGWNNSWQDAVRTYERFIAGYGALPEERGLTLGRPHRPLLIGLYWPSAILVLPGEGRRDLAGGGDDAGGAAADAEQHAVDELASEVAGEHVARFLELAGRETLEPDEAEELAAILGPVYEREDEFEPVTPPSAEERPSLWAGDDRALFGGVLVKVRDAIRQATVWLMKDRAGRVGANGLAPLLGDLQRASPTARLHLLGHSFGCRVLLSGICAQEPPRRVSSVLLLQAAINHLCFATDATGDGQPGGFRPALDRVEQPILTTFSSRDESLTRYFHLALRRHSDVGERALAAGAPSPYAALGGYGPGGCGPECEGITMPDVGGPYPLGPGGPRLIGVDGSAVISNHGDISNPGVWWTLWSQVSKA